MVDFHLVSLNIKNPDTEVLARRLADVTGESVTGAVTVALRERLERLERANADETNERAEAIRAIARDAAPRWKEPYRSGEHGDLLYDASGLPK
jgi:antitoxin VapB